MQELLKYLPSVKTLFMLAAFCALVVFGFKDTITDLALAGKNEALSLLLGFLSLLLISVLGVAGFYAISKKEIDAESKRANTASIKGSKKVKGRQTGKGGFIEIEDSEEVELEQDNREQIEDEDPEAKKKA